MEIPRSISRVLLLLMLLFLVGNVMQVEAASSFYCGNIRSRCFRRVIQCPSECPDTTPTDPKAKACYVKCNSPLCTAECRHRIPNCNGFGSACYDPRFIGGDGIVFYFHGKANHHFALVSDTALQINARFIGHRPATRTRDYTWIQALGILFNSQSLTLEATKAETGNKDTDHLKFTYNGSQLSLQQGPLSMWGSPQKDIKLQRISSKNSVLITLEDMAEIMINVVPVTKEDDRIHNYQLPPDDCFAHFEVQFRFLGLSGMVEGVLGRTYRADFDNPAAKPGVAMPVVGGDDKYQTSSLLGADCRVCVFYPGVVMFPGKEQTLPVKELGMLDCAQRGLSSGYGIVCKK